MQQLDLCFLDGAAAIRAESAVIRDLWRRAPHAHPFCNAGYLHAAALECETRGERPFLVIGRRNAVPELVLPMRLHGGGMLAFLPLSYFDYCGPLCGEEVPPAQIASALVGAVQHAQARALRCDYLPAWGPGLESLARATRAIGWHAVATPCRVNPLLGANDGGELRQLVERHKRIKTYANKLGKRGYSLEVVEGSEGLDAWADEFSAHHEHGWYRKKELSVYSRPGSRTRFLSYLRGFSDDGTLLRFAVFDGRLRLAQAVALKFGDRLIYHHITHAPEHPETRAGHVLIRLMGLWMADHDFRILDFGCGDEGYKFRYANRNEWVSRFYAAPHRTSKTYVQGWLEKRIRGSAPLLRTWNQGVNGMLKPRLKAARLHYRNIVPRAEGCGALVNLPRRWATTLWQRQYLCLAATAPAETAGPLADGLGPLPLASLLEGDAARSLTPAERVRFIVWHGRGDRPWVWMPGGSIVALMWLGRRSGEHYPGARLSGDFAALHGARRFRSIDLPVRRALLETVRGSLPRRTRLIVETDRELLRRATLDEAGFVQLASRSCRPRWLGGSGPWQPLADEPPVEPC